MGLVDKIKADVKKSGQNKGKFIYFREGQKIRIRFLTDIEDGLEVIFHDKYDAGINVPCQETFGRQCKYCDDDSLRTRSQYIWSVYNYETNEVQLFMFPVNNCSPVPALMAMYENYGTLVDRDYVLSVSGKRQNKTFSVVPMDKVKFRNKKAKAYSKASVLKMLDKAYPNPDDEDNEEEDDDDDIPVTKKSKSKAIKKSKAKKKVIDDDDDDYDDSWSDDDDEDGVDYTSLSAKELYKLCVERDIDAKIKKPVKYYINLLEEYDEAQDNWGDEEDEEDDDDEWA